MSYVEHVINASGGHAAPAENLTSDKKKAPKGYHYMPDGTLMKDSEHSIRAALEAAGMLVPEEQDLADALLEIAEKYGKFNDDNTGVWAGYESAEENAENAAIGVKCGNCVFWEAPNGCKIIQATTEEGGLCRFAILPDGAVTPEYKLVEEVFSKPPQLVQEKLKSKIEELGDSYTEEYLEIQDLSPTQNYLKPEKFKDAQSFTKPVVVYKDETGYKLVDGHHRCASKVMDGQSGIRAKVYTGPVIAAADSNPCWDGYVQVGMKEKNGKMVPNCVPADEAALYATAGSKPAPKSEQIKGSDKNPKGSASGGKSVTFSKKVEKSLQDKADKHNEKYGDTASKKTSLKTLKAVYRRGAGAFSTSHRPDQNRNSWAMARVNAFLHLLRTGKPKNAKYVTDNDLLPAAHPKSSKTSASITAAAYDQYLDSTLEVSLLEKEQYLNDEHAIFALAEFSGLGYETVPSFRAAWLRGVRDEESGFERAKELATNLYESKDADLLPNKELLDELF